MCIKKIAGWFKPDPHVVVDADRVALLFGINDYKTAPLRGCINDVNDVAAKLKKEFPDIVIKIFRDSEVTTQRFVQECETALLHTRKMLYIHYSGHGTQIGKQEALYLYNGPLMDDVICDLQNRTPDYLNVVAKFDSCFSGGMDDRKLARKNRYLASRYYHIPGVKVERATRRIARADVQRWVIFSGCGEEQTSADAFFGGRANGAFTYYDLRSYNKDVTYRGEFNALRVWLPNLRLGFDQAPELSGDSSRFGNKVFE